VLAGSDACFRLHAGVTTMADEMSITDGASVEAQFRLLVDSAADHAIYTLDPAGLITSWNAGAVRLHGYTAAEALGRSHSILFTAEDVGAGVPQRELAAAARAGPTPEVWSVRKDGTPFRASRATTALRDGDGRPTGFAIVVRDLSEQRAHERAAADALAALRQSQFLARIAGAAARLGGWAVDVSEAAVMWSDEVCILHDVEPGYRPTLENAINFYAPEHRAAITRAVTECLQAGTPFDLELEIISAKGRRLWVRAIGDAVRNDAGRVVKIQGAFQDVSAVRQSIDAVRLSEERFRLLSRATNDAVWDWDLVTNTLWWNEGVETLLGYRRDQLAPAAGFRLDRIHPDDLEATAAIIQSAIDGGAESWSAEYRFRHESGHYVWVLDRGYIQRDSTGAAVRMIGGMIDLTARKADAERITEQAALLDEARDAIAVHDLDLRLTYMNRSAMQLYGFDSLDIAKGSSISELYLDATTIEAARQATIEHGGWCGELKVKGRGKRPLVVASQWSLVRDKGGRARALLIISTDITEKKSLEAQAIRAQRMESIGTLAGGIAHDLNNILAPILTSIDFLRDEVGENADALDALTTLDVCARRGAGLVKQVLSFARGVEGKRMTVNVAHLARELLDVLKETLPKSIALRFNPSRDLWTVSGDTTQLHQVLLNLCVNARDAMAAGGRLDVSLQNVVVDETYSSMHAGARPGAYVVVEVADTGTGIPAEIRERIFDPFFTTKEVGKGTGLGLSTTQTIVNSHNGFISVQSEVGKGTKFRVYLPSDGSRADATEGAEPAKLPRGAGELVLVVDDEEAIRRILRTTLERNGYEVMLASHGAEAVGLYAQHRDKIALVLTDMAMPVMDGAATVLAIKAINANAHIVGSSGFTADSEQARLAGAGIKHFVPKPYTAEALLNTVGECLGKTRAA
jgi:two-component system, cell cycle sensor histidine kinase and response regulator CckA